MQLGSLVGQDIGKGIFFVLIVAGVLIATFNMLQPNYAVPNIGEILSAGHWIYDWFLNLIL